MVDVPTNICHSGSHACFGYLVLGPSFRNLAEIFCSVVELCGTPQLPCPVLSRPSSILTQLPSTSLQPKADTPFTMGDYVNSEEDLELVIANLYQQEASETQVSLPVPSVR